MIIDKKGKLFGKISIVDIIIVVVIAVSIGGAYYKYTKSETIKIPERLDSYVLQFITEESPDYAVASVEKGETVREFPDKVTMGKVTDVQVELPKSLILNEKKQFVTVSKPGFSSMLLTVEGTGKYSDSGLRMGKSLFLIGKTINIQVGNTVFSGKVYSLKKK